MKFHCCLRRCSLAKLFFGGRWISSPGEEASAGAARRCVASPNALKCSHGTPLPFTLSPLCGPEPGEIRGSRKEILVQEGLSQCGLWVGQGREEGQQLSFQVRERKDSSSEK